MGVDRIVLPDRDLLPGVEIDTDLGRWQVYETPGHAPSHVTLHQPDRGVLISGDHLLGRVSLYYDYGWTPDPAGEFLSSLDVVDELDASLCLSGHGRPFRDVREHVDANRREVHERIGLVRAALEQGAKTPFEIVPALIGEENSSTPMMVTWGLGEVLVYLRYLERREQVAKVDPAAADDVQRWALAPPEPIGLQPRRERVREPARRAVVELEEQQRLDHLELDQRSLPSSPRTRSTRA